MDNQNRTARPFFTALGALAGSMRRENQVSRTFAACFNESPLFRALTLPVFWRALGRSGLPPDLSQWSCHAEVQAPKPGGGRVDLHFVLAYQANLQSFYVESKVESALTNSQLAKYALHGVSPLVAITKYRPDESIDVPRVAGLRWQDVHRALRRPQGGNGVERQLCRWMAEYLEDLDMAYREDLTIAEVALCGKLFRCGRSTDKWSSVGALRALEAAQGLAGMIDDLYVDLVDAHPRLGKAPYGRTQTQYAIWTDPSDHSTSHNLRWSIRKTDWKKWELICGMTWPDAAPSDRGRFCLQLSGTSVKKEQFADNAAGRFLTAGLLDRAKLFRYLKDHVSEWHVA